MSVFEDDMISYRENLKEPIHKAPRTSELCNAMGICNAIPLRIAPNKVKLRRKITRHGQHLHARKYENINERNPRTT